MKRKLALLLSAVMMLSTTACGQDDDDDDDDRSTTRRSNRRTSAYTGEDDDEEEETTQKTTKKKKPTEGSSEISTEPATKPQGKQVINLWAFTDEVPNMVKEYIRMNPDFADKYEVKETLIGTSDGAYQPALNQALAGGGKDAPDIYCAEAAFVDKYVKGDYSGYAMPYSELIKSFDKKLTQADIAPYSLNIGTNEYGDIVGMGYQSTSGAFIYRRSIAKDVFGSDDPKTVEAKIGAGSGKWDKFFDTAAELRSHGYATLSGYGDLWQPVSDSAQYGWIVNDRLNIDPKREDFLGLAKALYDNNYTNDSGIWTEEWFHDMEGRGNRPVFGYFGPSWLVNYTLSYNCGGDRPGEGSYGDWAVCTPPVGFFWGGTWLMANKDTQVKEGVAELLEWITLDTSKDGLQYMWANGKFGGTKDTVVSSAVMKISDGSIDFLGGQNMFDAYIKANGMANGKNTTPYDEVISGHWQDQVREYVEGYKSYTEAIRDFEDDMYYYYNI